MKHKVGISIAVCATIMAIFFGRMTYASGQGTFALEDVSGSRDYLNLFPLEGFAGDVTHGMIFTLAEGNLEVKQYPVGRSEIESIFLAKRDGVSGLSQYGYYSGMGKYEVWDHVAAAPMAGAKVETFDKIDEAIKKEGYGNRWAGDEDTEEMVRTDGIALYGEIEDGQFDTSLRFDTGVVMKEQSFAFTRMYNKDTRDLSTYDTFDERGIEMQMVEKGVDRLYVLMTTNAGCSGENRLMFLPRKMAEPKLSIGISLEEKEPWPEPMYSEETYGTATEITRLPVSKDQQILAMIDGGENALAVMHTIGDGLYLSQYDLTGKVLDQERIMETGAKEIRDLYTDVTVFQDGSVSLWFQADRFLREEADGNVITQRMGEGLCQLDGAGIQVMKYQDPKDAQRLALAKNDLVLQVIDLMAKDPAAQLMGYIQDDTKILVSQGVTGEILYEGLLIDDFYEDGFNRIAKLALHKDGFLNKKESGALVDQNTLEGAKRIIQTVEPMNARRTTEWLRSRI